MGSTNTGRFTDYSDNSTGKRKPSGDGGGSSGDDPCQKAFSAELEEVERCEYYRKYSILPAKGTEVDIILNARLEAVNKGGETIGYLPTKFNYLAACIEEGNLYSGIVSSTTKTPIIKVSVDIAPV